MGEKDYPGTKFIPGIPEEENISLIDVKKSSDMEKPNIHRGIINVIDG